jgi:hypothetical protein
MRGVSWVAGLLASGLLLYFLVATAPAREPTVADHLRYTSVHVAPGTDGELDATRTREVIGLRPIVVAVGDGVRCAAIVAALPDVIAIVLPGLDVCGGADARGHDASLAARVRGAPDVVAAYVRAYDARFAGDPPRRDPPATEAGPDARQVVTLAAAALFAALFVLTAVFVIRFGLRGPAGARGPDPQLACPWGRPSQPAGRPGPLVRRDGRGRDREAVRARAARVRGRRHRTGPGRGRRDADRAGARVGVLPKKVMSPRPPKPKLMSRAWTTLPDTVPEIWLTTPPSRAATCCHRVPQFRREPGGRSHLIYISEPTTG